MYLKKKFGCRTKLYVNIYMWHHHYLRSYNFKFKFCHIFSGNYKFVWLCSSDFIIHYHVWMPANPILFLIPNFKLKVIYVCIILTEIKHFVKKSTWWFSPLILWTEFKYFGGNLILLGVKVYEMAFFVTICVINLLLSFYSRGNFW